MRKILPILLMLISSCKSNHAKYTYRLLTFECACDCIRRENIKCKCLKDIKNIDGVFPGLPSNKLPFLKDTLIIETIKDDSIIKRDTFYLPYGTFNFDSITWKQMENFSGVPRYKYKGKEPKLDPLKSIIIDSTQ